MHSHNFLPQATHLHFSSFSFPSSLVFHCRSSSSQTNFYIFYIFYIPHQLFFPFYPLFLISLFFPLSLLYIPLRHFTYYISLFLPVTYLSHYSTHTYLNPTYFPLCFPFFSSSLHCLSPQYHKLSTTLPPVSHFLSICNSTSTYLFYLLIMPASPVLLFMLHLSAARMPPATR